MSQWRKARWWVGVAGVLVSTMGHAGTLPAGTVDQISAVTFHTWAPFPSSYGEMAAAGLHVARTDLHWTDVESSAGHYDFSHYDPIVAGLLQAGLRPLLVLDYSNPLYEAQGIWPAGGPAPGSTYVAAPEDGGGQAAYAAFAGAAAAHYAGQGIVWELWNEPNNLIYWPATAPNAAAYAAMALQACQAIRAADPSATVIGPAVSPYDTDFMATVLASGLPACLDGLSVHPYPQGLASGPPEDALAAYASVRALMAAKGLNLPLVNSEAGYSTGYGGVGYDQSPEFAVRQKLVDLMSGLALSTTYEWSSESLDPLDYEGNFGLIDPFGRERPAYLALQVLHRQLGNARWVGSLRDSSDGGYVEQFQRADGTTVLVGWTTQILAPVTVSLTGLACAGSLPIVGLLGSALPLQALITGCGELQLDLSAAVQYIVLPTPTGS